MAHHLHQQYAQKRISAHQAAGMVASGMTVHLSGSANLATIIDKYLSRRVKELKNVTLHTYLDTMPYRCCEVDPQGEVFRWYSGFILGYTRALSRERGIGVYRSSTWHNVPAFLRSEPKYDFCFLVTAPMDGSGYFNFGLTVGESMAIADSSRKIVAVVRPDMPTLCGGNQEAIHISRIDHIVEDNEFETICLPPVQADDRDGAIARHIMASGLIGNGSTLQIGIGGLPNSVLDMLKDSGFRHCGFHTEMLTEKMLDLIEAGVVDNSRKRLDRYRTVFTFCLGSRTLYDYADRNPAFASYPVDYTNNPLVIARQPNMFSLNSAAQVDLSGQVASEQIGGTRPVQISGTGGQLDFVMGTMLAEDGNGVSVLALYSEHKGESKIVPLLESGATVTVPRSMVDHVATEWGLARLRGLSNNERARALIAIAHPKFRNDLTRKARDAGLLPYGAGFSGKRPAGVLSQSDASH